MSDDRQRDHDPFEWHDRATHLSDYVAVLRQRPALFWLTFLVVSGGLLAGALLARPVYRSSATLQIEAAAPDGGLLGDLKAMEDYSTARTEIEIMRSQSVAREAFRSLEPGVFVVEKHAYRPLEVLLRALLGRPDPEPVTVETRALAEGESQEIYALEFRDAGLTVERRASGGGRGEVVTRTSIQGFAPGKEFQAFGRRFVVRADRFPTGRRFVLTLLPPRAATDWIRRHTIVAEVSKHTGVVHLGFEAETPQMAQGVAAALTESYLALKEQQRRTQVDKALLFLRGEIAVARKRLAEAEAALDQYRASSDAVLLSERAAWIVEKTSMFRLERAEQRVLLAELRSLRVSAAEAADVSSILQALGTAGADAMTVALSGSLAALELERSELAEIGATPEHPQYRRVEAAIQAGRERLRMHLVAAVEKRIEHVEGQVAYLERSIETYEEQARELPETERRITELSREARANLQVYDFLVEKEQEAQLARASTLATVRAIDPALEPATRESPILYLRAMLAALLGLCCAALLSFFVNYLDRSLKNPRELEAETGLPVYATIPLFRTVPERSLRSMSGVLVTRERPNSMISEVYRALLTNLRFAGPERSVRSVAITSALLGEGKTLTLMNLAVAAAQVGERAIIVDADLRRPTTHQHFGSDRSPGLCDVLEERADWRDVVHGTDQANLTVLHAGAAGAQPGALMRSPVIGDLLEDLKANFDWVLFDVSPILAVADTSAFLARLDAVLLLARYRACSLEAVLAARDQLRRVDANLLGLVFNGIDGRRARRRGYGSYYGHYGHYYHDGERVDEPSGASSDRPDRAMRSGKDGP